MKLPIARLIGLTFAGVAVLSMSACVAAPVAGPGYGYGGAYYGGDAGYATGSYYDGGYAYPYAYNYPYAGGVYFNYDNYHHGDGGYRGGRPGWNGGHPSGNNGSYGRPGGGVPNAAAAAQAHGGFAGRPGSSGRGSFVGRSRSGH